MAEVQSRASDATSEPDRASGPLPRLTPESQVKSKTQTSPGLVKRRRPHHQAVAVMRTVACVTPLTARAVGLLTTESMAQEGAVATVPPTPTGRHGTCPDSPR